MAINLASLSPITTTATSLSNLILVKPQAQTGFSPQPVSTDPLAEKQPSLLFHYEGEQSVSVESDITDHYVEDNTAVQDHIALKPETITTHGFIGELNDVAPVGLSALKTAAETLVVLNAYTPALTTAGLIAYNEAFQLYQVGKNAVNAAVSAWSGNDEKIIDANGNITGNQTQTLQQIYFQQFYGYWRARTFFTVQTPWAIFNDMVIKSLRAVQDAETRMITDFEITFKRIRKASTITTAVATLRFDRSAAGAAKLTDLGTSAGTPAPFTLTDKLSGF